MDSPYSFEPTHTEQPDIFESLVDTMCKILTVMEKNPYATHDDNQLVIHMLYTAGMFIPNTDYHRQLLKTVEDRLAKVMKKRW